MLNIFLKDNSGYTAIASALALGAAMLIIASASAWSNIENLSIEELSSKNTGLNAHLSACLEEALIRIRLDNGYRAQDSSIMLPGGECILGVTEEGASIKVEAEVHKDNLMKSGEAIVQLSDTGAVRLISWREL